MHEEEDISGNHVSQAYILRWTYVLMACSSVNATLPQLDECSLVVSCLGVLILCCHVSYAECRLVWLGWGHVHRPRHGLGHVHGIRHLGNRVVRGQQCMTFGCIESGYVSIVPSVGGSITE